MNPQLIFAAASVATDGGFVNYIDSAFAGASVSNTAADASVP